MPYPRGFIDALVKCQNTNFQIKKEIKSISWEFFLKPMPIFSNINEHLNSPFEQLNDEFLD